MNDKEIRSLFKKKRLSYSSSNPNTLVIEELGLNHGECRADIALISNKLVGYEIKSDRDSLFRLERQVKLYDQVFDKSSIITGCKYVDAVKDQIPSHWGIICIYNGPRGGTNIETIRAASFNVNTNPMSMVKLLWKNEVIDILSSKGICEKEFNKPRSILYNYLLETCSICEIKKQIKKYLINRKNWRGPQSLSLSGGLYRPSSM